MYLLVYFLNVEDEEVRYMEHNFAEKDNSVFNRNNEALINTKFNGFIDELKGKIAAWSQRGSGWVRRSSDSIRLCCPILAVSPRKLHAPAQKADK